jgi:flagellar protein FliJ
MTPFRFSLERVLEWRRLQLRAEEEKLAALQHRLQQADQRIASLLAAQQKSEWSYRKLPAIAGSDLQSLAPFQSRVNRQRAALEEERRKIEALVEAQRLRVQKAAQESRVLEKLKERRYQAWAYEADREIENAAADAYIAKIVRSRSEE